MPSWHQIIRPTSAEITMTALGTGSSDGRSVQVTCSASISRKVRRRRTVYSRSHVDLLLKTFHTNPYPGIALREKLSRITGVHESRIQVWFQNRRARKNKMNDKGPENLPQQAECQQFNQVPRVRQSTQSKRQLFQMGHTDNHQHIYKNYAFPLHPLGYLHTNSLVNAQHLNHGRLNHCQPIHSAASSGPLRSTNTIAQQSYPYIQQASSRHAPHTTSTVEISRAEYTPFISSLQPGHVTTQELSLQDILEEFQPCWTEVTNNCSSVTNDLLPLI